MRSDTGTAHRVWIVVDMRPPVGAVAAHPDRACPASMVNPRPDVEIGVSGDDGRSAGARTGPTAVPSCTKGSRALTA
jgi:hypothetical protein